MADHYLLVVIIMKDYVKAKIGVWKLSEDAEEALYDAVHLRSDPDGPLYADRQQGTF